MPIVTWNHNQARYHKNLLRDGRNLELSIHSKGAPTLQWRQVSQVSQVSHSFGGKPQQIEKPCKTHSADPASSPPHQLLWSSTFTTFHFSHYEHSPGHISSGVAHTYFRAKT